MYSITVDFGNISSETFNMYCMGNEKPYTKSNSMEIGIQILLIYFEHVSLDLTRIYIGLCLYDVCLGAIKLLSMILQERKMLTIINRTKSCNLSE
jgi:hypothetical protein